MSHASTCLCCRPHMTRNTLQQVLWPPSKTIFPPMLRLILKSLAMTDFETPHHPESSNNTLQPLHFEGYVLGSSCALFPASHGFIRLVVAGLHGRQQHTHSSMMQKCARALLPQAVHFDSPFLPNADQSKPLPAFEQCLCTG